jgi:hypothetical protein
MSYELCYACPSVAPIRIGVGGSWCMGAGVAHYLIRQWRIHHTHAHSLTTTNY